MRKLFYSAAAFIKFFINSEAALNQGVNFSDSSCFSQMIIRIELDGKRLFKLFSEFILSKNTSHNLTNINKFSLYHIDYVWHFERSFRIYQNNVALVTNQVNPLNSKPASNFSLQSHCWIKHWIYESKGNDPQLRRLWLLNQFFMSFTKRM